MVSGGTFSFQEGEEKKKRGRSCVIGIVAAGSLSTNKKRRGETRDDK